MKWLDSLAVRWLRWRGRSVVIGTTFKGGIRIDNPDGSIVAGNTFIP